MIRLSDVLLSVAGFLFVLVVGSFCLWLSEVGGWTRFLVAAAVVGPIAVGVVRSYLP